LLDSAGIIESFLTIAGTIFIVELTDKDALFLLSLATTKSGWLVFAAGSIAFTMTSGIIVLLGSALVSYVPVVWIKVAGGGIMLAYALWGYVRGLKAERSIERVEERLLEREGKRELYAFLVIVSSLMILDLAGDATELVTILFVAQYRDVLLVFIGAVAALVAASGLEAILGNRLGRLLSARGARYLSTAVFLIIGTVIIVTSLPGL
jgi:putative Ca2+/H+ antiporter (TMEM165/GDT1 family)